jgi:UDP-2-acetamido-3-amino-2,3-dideoxy-glucuronate N-acetyltransferase
VTVHPTALVETDRLGGGTRVWAFTHVASGATVGRDCNIGSHCYLESGVVVGDAVTIKNGNHLWAGVTLDDGVFVGPGVVFTNDRFPRSPRLGVTGSRYASPESWLVPTRVRRGATIGAGAVIVAGVTIGAFAFVAAAALVTSDVPAHALVMGRPARQVGWACLCARRLAPSRDGKWACPECGRRYVLEGDRMAGPVGDDAGS